MKSNVIIGVILIVLGVAALTYRGFTYTKRDTAKLGPIRLEADQPETVPIPPILAYVAIAGGIVVLVAGSRGGNS